MKWINTNIQLWILLVETTHSHGQVDGISSSEHCMVQLVDNCRGEEREGEERVGERVVRRGWVRGWVG